MIMDTTTSTTGNRVRRREDPPLLTGAAKYVADIDCPGALHAVFVRSDRAHGTITAVDVADAIASPGVLAVLTGKDLDLPPIPETPRPGHLSRPALARPCLAIDRVRYVGEPIALVVATTAAAARDGADQVVVEMDTLPAIIDLEAAGAPESQPIFPDFGSNVVLESHTGEYDDVLAGAEVVVRGRFVNQRVAAVPMEPGGILVIPEGDGYLDCFVSCQTPFVVRGGIARALNKPESRVRVRAPEVGGGFGAKGGVYPEHVVVAAAAARLGRPIRHVETRSENMVAMSHGRGQLQEVALGARRDGTLVGMEARTVTDVGGYLWRGALPWNRARLMVTGVYRIPRLSLHSLAVVTNTTPIGPYRGAGRPEAAAMIERAMDMLAQELGMDPAEIRRRNLLEPQDFPYTTASGASYDSGAYAAALEEALSLSGYEELRREQAARRAVGDVCQLGIGLSTFTEISGEGFEYGSVRVSDDGSVVVTTGASPHGQGHETAFSQLVGTMLSVPATIVRIVHSDTGAVPRGVGTFGSRSGQLAGSAIVEAGEEVLRQAREAAADLLEADPQDVVLVEGGWAVNGVPATRLSWEEIVASVPERQLSAESDFTQAEGTYPFGAHVAVVEVDTETGGVRLRRIIAVDDCGRVINPMIVEGQVHGGLAQGIGQALFEEVRYDDLGNPITANLADYGVPSAAELPSFELGETVTPSPRNPLGAKGVGESGAVGVTPAVQNAVIDALAPFGVRHIDMPLTAERVWRAIRSAGE